MPWRGFFTSYTMAQGFVLQAFGVLIMLAAVYFYLHGTMSLANTLMSIIISFLVFSQIESAGSGMAMLRLVGSSIDHANQTDVIPQMDEGGSAIHPESHDIMLENVHFSYGK